MRRFVDGRRWPVVLFAATIATLSGCEGTGAPLAAPPTPESLNQKFGPSYAAAPPTGQLNRIDDATISEDGRTLTVAFTGGPGYSPTDFCSTDYEPWVAADGDELRVAIARVTHGNQATAPPNAGCAAMGYPWSFELLLPRPFLGSTIHDLGGNTLWVREPAALVTAAVLPPGWELRLSRDEPEARPPLWARVYAPSGANVEAPNRGAGQLDLYQAFGAATNIGGGSERQDVRVNGGRAVLLRDPAFGELLLQWVIGGDGVALVGNEADLTVDQFLEIARAVEPAE